MANIIPVGLTGIFRSRQGKMWMCRRLHHIRDFSVFAQEMNSFLQPANINLLHVKWSEPVMKAVPHVTGLTGSGRSAKLTSCYTQQRLQNTHGETTWSKEQVWRQNVHIVIFYKWRWDVCGQAPKLSKNFFL